MLSEKSKYVAYLYVLETIQIASQVNTKTTTTTKKKDNTYTLRGYLMSSKLGETLMSHLKRPSIT